MTVIYTKEHSNNPYYPVPICYYRFHHATSIWVQTTAASAISALASTRSMSEFSPAFTCSSLRIHFIWPHSRVCYHSTQSDTVQAYQSACIQQSPNIHDAELYSHCGPQSDKSNLNEMPEWEATLVQIPRCEWPEGSLDKAASEVTSGPSGTSAAR